MDVTRAREQRSGRRQSKGERRSFSNTAGRTHAANVGSGLPKRGGIRL
ncbi:MAG: hypothetical protein [Arizlama microvirus]|nr:MAG: hypothetical protein [Arizlama microvirus]